MESNISINHTDEPRPLFWERQPTETTAAFEAFCHYRDSGATRSLRKTRRELDRPWTTISDWSSKHLWTARAESYDAHVDAERRKERERQIVAHLDRAASLGRFMQSVGLAGLREIEGQRPTRPPVELVKYIVAGIAEERRALGLPSEAVVVDHRSGPPDPDGNAYRTSETLRRAREALDR
jgi:hypothetical protein